MYWFLLMFFSVYGLMHFYMYIKIRRAFKFSGIVRVFIGGFMLLMTLAPMLTRMLANNDFNYLSFITYCAGFSWMAILFLFLALSVLIDLYVLALKIISFSGKRKLRLPSFKTRFFIPVILTALIFIYGYIEAKNVRIEEVKIVTEKLARDIGEIKIVQITDLHLGLIVNERRMKNVSEKIMALNPDIIVSTGDFIDGRIFYNDIIMELFNNKHTKYGKYASTGNHEFFVGIEKADRLAKEAGFFVLRNRVVTIPGVINIAGVDDNTALRYGFDIPLEKDILKEADKDLFTVLLKHRPEVDENSLGKFDLQLSGHSHGGQIFPFTVIIKMAYPYLAGLYELDKGSLIYVSRGTGLWGPPIRFLAPPEITLIRIISK